ncbi:hypothetical protein [Martelella endophytica]|uniref:hypothetical protein n=1 Tax=Martelella endophytica TaxID=1486262 RepID=UPI000698AA97|nr:hypothetical protein [Martelella endophytica]
MPSPGEVLFYLRGLWLLFRGDAGHARYLDFTERGFRRSFWAFAYSLPMMVISELLTLSRLSRVPVEIDATVIFRSALIQGLSWMAPLVVIGVVCLVSGLPRAFLKVVVATNWLSLPINLIAVIAIFLAATGLEPLASLVLILLQVVVLAAFLFEIRIVYMLMGERALPTAAAVIASAMTALIITDFGTRYIVGL